MATTLLNPAGAVESPHPTTVPSLLSARLWLAPAAMAATLLNPAGAVESPQAITVPSSLSARLKNAPAATPVKTVPGSACGNTVESPQLTSSPGGKLGASETP